MRISLRELLFWSTLAAVGLASLQWNGIGVLALILIAYMALARLEYVQHPILLVVALVMIGVLVWLKLPTGQTY